MDGRPLPDWSHLRQLRSEDIEHGFAALAALKEYDIDGSLEVRVKLGMLLA